MIPKEKVKRFIKIFLIVTFIILTINVLQIPKLIKCEILTAKYGHEFADSELYEQSSWIRNVEKLKVLKYDETDATVYYICINGTFHNGQAHKGGDIASFRRNSSGEWEFVKESTVWSETGTADGYVKPYWWHWFIY